ncbi:hypothetical protein [Methyloceanibacter sp.]|uniref:hypothetical protein n=1 Tax=Methyloceanibacter sp. TaxID=1965321 RepID=UPI002BFA250D|nr:hypothetical protein [Methyloceanibacter sp.]HML92947.1 hypothetical protein [Methyloceanibacter sp.]
MRRSAASETGTWALFALVAALIVILAGGFIWLLMSAKERPALDKVTLCPVDGEKSVTVVLLDTSDEWPDITRAEVRNRLGDIAADVPDYGLLELRLLEPSKSGGRVIFSKCNPGDGSNLSEIIGNPRMAHKIWMEQFNTPLQDALDKTMVTSESDSSPILSTIQRIAVDRFDDGRPGHLVVISDMVEHTPDYSQYKGDLSYDRYRQTAAYKKQHTNLEGVDVTIFYVRRLRMDSGKHIQFWTDWIADNNGALDEAVKLQGAD